MCALSCRPLCRQCPSRHRGRISVSSLSGQLARRCRTTLVKTIVFSMLYCSTSGTARLFGSNCSGPRTTSPLVSWPTPVPRVALLQLPPTVAAAAVLKSNDTTRALSNHAASMHSCLLEGARCLACADAALCAAAASIGSDDRPCVAQVIQGWRFYAAFSCVSWRTTRRAVRQTALWPAQGGSSWTPRSYGRHLLFILPLVTSSRVRTIHLRGCKACRTHGHVDAVGAG